MVEQVQGLCNRQSEYCTIVIASLALEALKINYLNKRISHMFLVSLWDGRGLRASKGFDTCRVVHADVENELSSV